MILPDQRTLLLLLALLLAFWLLTRVHTRESAPPPRRTPVTINELGRCVFEVATGHDFVGYRGLFLAGAEARTVLGDAAEVYLDRRTREFLERAMTALQALIPAGSHYEGIVVGDDGQATI